MRANTAMASAHRIARRSSGTRVRQKGFTLVEMLIVVIIAGLVATLGLSLLSTGDVSKLDLAISEVVGALRFARSEAIRTGEAHGAIATVADQSVRVYRLDESGPLPVATYDVYHPVTKKLYELQLDSGLDFVGVKLEVSAFNYVGVGTAIDSVGFNASGTPTYNSGVVRLLTDGGIQLGLGQQSRDIDVAPITGRVTLQ